MQLKDVMEKNIDIEKYCPLASRVIELDEDMTIVAQKWQNVWASMQDYHLKGEDMERRQRIQDLHELLMGIRNPMVDVGEIITPEMDAIDYSELDDREEAWEHLCHRINHFHDFTRNVRFANGLKHEKCVKCKSARVHYV